MKDQKQSIIKEAIAEYELIQKVLKENTKEILRSVAKEEITSTLNESLNEDDYDIEDIEDDNAEDVGNLPVADSGAEMGEPEMGEPEIGGGEELGLDDMGMDSVEGSEDYAAEEGSEDYEMDMTSASDEEVISVYKKLSGEDEIEVISPSEVIITDPVSGAEYNVKLGGGSMLDQGEMDMDGELGLGSEMGDDLGEPEMEDELGLDAEMGGEEELGEPEMGDEELGEPEVEAEPEMGGEESEEGEESYEEEEEEDELGEGVVYEIELSDEDEIAEDIIRTKGHDKELVNTAAPNSGDIEGQKAPNDKDSGDNLVGGFKDDAQNGSGDAHAQHIMEDDLDESEEVIDEAEEALEESIPKGNGEARRVPGQAGIGQPVGTGAKHVPGVAGGKLKTEAMAQKYNKLLAEAKKLKSDNDMFRTSMKDFRKMLGETAVFNSNLTYVTKLFLEHSTTSTEKKQILGRFDNEVGTIEESKKLYKKIVSELGSKTPLKESVETKFVGSKTTSQSTQLNENRAYVDPSQSRIIDLMNRTKR